MGILEKFQLEAKRAVVTGAGQGIGRAIAIGLAEAGADVAVNDIKISDGTRDTEMEIRKLGRRSITIQADVSRKEEVRRMVDMVVEEFGGIDILVNNAGINIKLKAEEYDEETWDNVVDVNLKGTYLCSSEFGKRMILQGGGVIINVSSICSKLILRKDFQIAYHSSKGGVVLLTKALADEWAKYHIRVNAIGPGYTRTAMCPHGPQKMDTIPMGRIADPREMAPAVVFLASEAASYITGQELFIDGGYTICGSTPNSIPPKAVV